VTLPSRIFDQPGVSSPEPAQGAISQTDFELTRQNNHVLPTGCWVPIYECARRQLGKYDMRRSLGGREFWMCAQRLIFEMRLSVVPGIKPKNAHVLLPFSAE
jgi:hypothetical protein